MPKTHLDTYRCYIDSLKSTLDGLDMNELDRVTEVLADAFLNDRTVFVAGNGGSAATASHLACDFSKTTLGKDPKSRERRLRSISLSDSAPLMTAYGNDVHYDDIFAEALRTWARPGDVLIVISASGNSPNILKALTMASEIGVTTVAFLGFSGGRALDLVDHSILARSEHYGVIEDAHSVFMHMLTEHLKQVVHEAQPFTAHTAVVTVT